MEYLAPILAAVCIWWLITVVLMRRVAMPPRSYPRTFGAVSLVALLALGGVVASRDDPGLTGAYAGFLSALAVWAWHELSYLLGYVNGPRPRACPPAASGWRRFVFGVKACLYHELAIIATAAVLMALTWGAVNQVALWTFVILGLMRWSAKLNIFLGVRNLHREYWPEHLSYLQSFVRERPMNALFPLSVAAATAGIALLALTAAGAAPGSGRQAGALLMATLLALATLEHGFLMLRVPDDALWRLGTRPQR